MSGRGISTIGSKGHSYLCSNTVPFVILITFGVHSVAGSIGYLFYYPWIDVLDSLDRPVGGYWENNWPLLQTVLYILQTIPLSAVAFLLMALKQRPGSRGRSAGRHT